MTTIAEPREDGAAEPSSPAGSSEAGSPTDARAADRPAGPTDVARAEQEERSGVGNLTGDEAATALPQALKILGSVVAPTSLLTALMFYFGLMFAIGYFGHFGVNWTVLDLPVQDYLILSASSSIVPLIYVTGAMLLALWLYQLPLETLSVQTRRIMRRTLMPTVAISGLILVSLSMVDVWHPVFPISFPLETRGLSLSGGILLVAYAARLRRMLTTQRRTDHLPRHMPVGMLVVKWGAVFILMSVGLFWAAASYAVNAGQTEARGLEADLRCEADVILYSEKSLSVDVPGVREVINQSAEAAHRVRYDGLKLVPQSGNQYLFLPAGWTYPSGVAILLPRSESLRLEFGQPADVRHGTC